VISDNGPQFLSLEFQKFSKEWDFEQSTRSPGKRKGNGKVSAKESAVKVAKNLIRKALDAGSDPYLSILDYRNTPIQGMESSPVQRLINRRTRTLLMNALVP
jgi:beta-lactamase class D